MHSSFTIHKKWLKININLKLCICLDMRTGASTLLNYMYVYTEIKCQHIIISLR